MCKLHFAFSGDKCDVAMFLNKHFTVVIAHFKREFCRNILICVVESVYVKAAVHGVDIDCDGRIITP